MRLIGVPTLASFVVLSSMAYAQAPQPGQQVQSPSQPQRMPARPLRPGETPPKGTAVLKGQVLAAGTGAPVRRAQVRAMSMEGRGGGVTSTDAQGNYEIKELPAASTWPLITAVPFGGVSPGRSGRAGMRWGWVEG